MFSKHFAVYAYSIFNDTYFLYRCQCGTINKKPLLF